MGSHRCQGKSDGMSAPQSPSRLQLFPLTCGTSSAFALHRHIYAACDGWFGRDAIPPTCVLLPALEGFGGFGTVQSDACTSFNVSGPHLLPFLAPSLADPHRYASAMPSLCLMPHPPAPLNRSATIDSTSRPFSHTATPTSVEALLFVAWVPRCPGMPRFREGYGIVGRAAPPGSETRSNRMYVHTYVFVSYICLTNTLSCLPPPRTRSRISPLSFDTSFPTFASHVVFCLKGCHGRHVHVGTYP